jgi:hypothetical protein
MRVTALFLLVLSGTLSGTLSHADSDSQYNLNFSPSLFERTIAPLEISPDRIGDAVAVIKERWPSDFERYAERFRVVRAMCDAASKPVPRPKQNFAVTTLAEDLRFRNGRTFQQQNLKNQVAMLRGSMMMEIQLSNCPVVLGFPIDAKAYGRKLLIDYIERLIADIDTKDYGKCRGDIDAAIGPPFPSSTTLAKNKSTGSNLKIKQ